MPSVEIDLDDTYEIDVDHFSPGSAPTWDDAGDGAEITLGDNVAVWGLEFKITGPGAGNSVPAVVDRITLAELVTRYRDFHGHSSDKEAARELEDECIDLMLEQLEDSYDE